jgi:thiol-disulfide isomerase/thioredoxin
MFKKIIVCMLLLATAQTLAYSQQKTTALKKINIGEQIPDYMLKGMINFPSKTVNLRAFKGKILIFDFWTFGCTACVESWPKLLKLQENFKDKIQIITINVYNNEQETTAFIKRQEKLNQLKMTIPVSCGDKNMMAFFPHQFVPHIIFVDQAGFVKNIGEGADLTDKTIQAMLASKEIKIPEKTDELAINVNKTLFINGNSSKQQKDSLIASFMLSPYSSNIQSVAYMYGGLEDVKDHKTSVFIGNYPIKSIFSVLYGKGRDLRLAVRNSRIAFRDVDTSKLVLKVGGELKRENMYTLQYIVPRQIPMSMLKKQAIELFETSVGYKARWEKQKRHCLIISRSDTTITEFKDGPLSEAIYSRGIRVNGMTMGEFITKLNYYIPSFSKMDYPIVDETGFKGKLGKIEFKLEQGTLDYRNLGPLLEKYGLKFTIEERETDILVISRYNIEPGEFLYP